MFVLNPLPIVTCYEVVELTESDYSSLGCGMGIGGLIRDSC